MTRWGASQANWGRELFRDGDWVLFHDYLPRGTGWKVGIGHHCRGENWRTRIGINPSVSEQCSNCGVTVPEKLIGLQKLAEWDSPIRYAPGALAPPQL